MSRNIYIHQNKTYLHQNKTNNLLCKLFMSYIFSCKVLKFYGDHHFIGDRGDHIHSALKNFIKSNVLQRMFNEDHVYFACKNMFWRTICF